MNFLIVFLLLVPFKFMHTLKVAEPIQSDLKKFHYKITSVLLS